MIVGITGSRDGLTRDQHRQLVLYLRAHPEIEEVHHGDCVGVDAQAHVCVRTYLPHANIIIHPPSNPSQRAFCKGDTCLPHKPYLRRNEDIVRACHVLLAFPGTKTRGGTQYTITTARKMKVKTQVFSPTSLRGFLSLSPTKTSSMGPHHTVNPEASPKRHTPSQPNADMTTAPTALQP